jgi:hypothetical protein
VNPDQALLWNAGTCRSNAKGEVQVGDPCKGKSTEVEHRDGAVRSRDESSEQGWTEGIAVARQVQLANRQREEPHDQGTAV